jgi:hypothetical protein
MSDTVKGVVAGALIAVGAVFAISMLVRPELAQNVMNTFTSEGDDRPPIVVSEGSIKFKHDKEWEDHGTANPRKWKSKQQNGKPVKSFDVEVTGLHTTACSTKLNGKLAVFDFIDENGDERTFVLFLDRDTANKLHPVIESTEQLTVDTDPTIIKFGTSGTSGNNVGEIVRMDVVGGGVSQTCTFSAAAKPEIKVTFVYK